jgi:hypothetical protein
VPIPGETFTLTTAADLITGTDNDDIITGYVGTNSAQGTLMDTFQSVDVIDGGAGNDSLSVSSDTANGNIGATINGVEELTFTTYKAGTLAAGTIARAANLNLSNVSGLETLTNKNSIATFVVNNAGAMDLGVVNVNNNITDISYGATAYVGIDDSATLTLNNASNQSRITLTGAGTIETLNVVTTGAESKVDLGGTLLAGTTKIVATGDQNLSFDDTDGTTPLAALKTIDASGLSGTLDADLTNGGVVDLAITGSAQDDKVAIRNFTKDDVVDLGEGSDKLTISVGTSVTAAANLANIETLVLAPTVSPVSVNLAGATELEVLALGASANTLSVTKAVSTVKTIAFDAGGVAVDTALTTLNFALATKSGTDDEITLNYTNTDAFGNLINTTKGAQLTSVVQANGIENVTISTDALHPDNLLTTAATADGGLRIALSDDKLQVLTIKSETLVDTAFGADGVAGGGDDTPLAATLKTVNASEATGGVRLDLTNAGDATTVAAGGTGSVTVTTGSGNDYIQGADAAVAMTISTGAGADVITNAVAQTKTLTIDAGEGDDSIDISGGAATAQKANITLGDGVDKLTVGRADALITVEDFTTGSAGDKWDFSGANDANTGGAATVVYAEGDFTGVGALVGGINVETSGNLTALTGTALSVFYGDTDGNDNDGVAVLSGNATDVAYVVATDGSDAGIFKVADDGTGTGVAGDGLINEDEVSLIGTLSGVTTLTGFNSDNFSDFL